MQTRPPTRISILASLAILLSLLAAAGTYSTWAAPGAQGTVPTPPPTTEVPPTDTPEATETPPEPSPTASFTPIMLELTPTESLEEATPTATPTATRRAATRAAQPKATAVGTQIPVGPYFVAVWDPERQVLTIYPTTPGAVIALGGATVAEPPTGATPVRRTPAPTRAPTPTATPLTVAKLRGRIIFKSDRDGKPFNYYVMNADGSNLQRLNKTAAEEFSKPLQAREGFSPDGSQVVLGERRCGYSLNIYTCGLYILDTQLHADLIFSDREPSQGTWFIQKNVKAKFPVWSPRGDYIVFVSNHETPEGCRKTPNLFKGTPTQKPVIRRLTEFCAGADTDHPSFSPDGAQVVFWSEFPTRRRDIFVVDVGADDNFDYRNTTPRLLTADEYNDWDPLWIK